MVGDTSEMDSCNDLEYALLGRQALKCICPHCGAYEDILASGMPVAELNTSTIVQAWSCQFCRLRHCIAGDNPSISLVPLPNPVIEISDDEEPPSRQLVSRRKPAPPANAEVIEIFDNEGQHKPEKMLESFAVKLTKLGIKVAQLTEWKKKNVSTLMKDVVFAQEEMPAGCTRGEDEDEDKGDAEDGDEDDDNVNNEDYEDDNDNDNDNEDKEEEDEFMEGDLELVWKANSLTDVDVMRKNGIRVFSVNLEALTIKEYGTAIQHHLECLWKEMGDPLCVEVLWDGIT
ncbi:hypothetical protein ARMGADRAFT_1075261 [Armillaria gallica]|uniref:Uncharacterized protein n=1 Tax=Armillaria gallica TaxID=47427 RepID=A0A2H3DX15_ARMGA|nr:hypothetical protein ARMGADRAFT_1075261 [Armillaria gallica]